MAYRSCTVYSIVGRKNGPLILYTLIENLADEATVLLSSVTKFSVIFLYLTNLCHSVISQIKRNKTVRLLFTIILSGLEDDVPPVLATAAVLSCAGQPPPLLYPPVLIQDRLQHLLKYI